MDPRGERLLWSSFGTEGDPYATTASNHNGDDNLMKFAARRATYKIPPKPPFVTRPPVRFPQSSLAAAKLGGVLPVAIGRVAHEADAGLEDV